MSLDRRQIMLGGIGLGAGTATLAGVQSAQAQAPAGVTASGFGVEPNSAADQTQALQRAIDATAPLGQPLHLPPGNYRVRQLTLKPGTQLLGSPGHSVLRYVGDDGFLAAEGGRDMRLDGVVLDGGGRPLGGSDGLLTANAVQRLTIRNCRLTASTKHGLALQGCSGAVAQCDISGAAQAGLFSLDARGLEISHNAVHDCANNGIQIWRSAPGEDGSLVTNNRIERIQAQDGGSGQNGNGVNLFRAGSVLVMGNRVTDCAFTAIRANAASDCQMIGNSCARLGEVALYSEFGFEGSVIASNLVDGAAAGISITNFNEGGRLAVAQGNLIRNLAFRKDADPRGIGIAVEADTLVTGNVIEGAPAVGILAGWGRYLRDVSITANTIRKARIGIGVSTAADAGYALITNNMISGASDGAIRAMNEDQPLGKDLAHASAESYRNIAVYGNVGL